MRRRLFGTRRRVVATSLALTLVVAGTAVAAWVVFANGFGRGQVASVDEPEITFAAPAPADACLPGNDCPISFNINNPNPFGLVLTNMTTPSATPITTGNPSCPASNFTFTPQSGLSIPVPAGSSLHKMSGLVTLSASAPTECQGVVITVELRGTFATT